MGRRPQAWRADEPSPRRGSAVSTGDVQATCRPTGHSRAWERQPAWRPRRPTESRGHRTELGEGLCPHSVGRGLARPLPERCRPSWKTPEQERRSWSQPPMQRELMNAPSWLPGRQPPGAAGTSPSSWLEDPQTQSPQQTRGRDRRHGRVVQQGRTAGSGTLLASVGRRAALRFPRTRTSRMHAASTRDVRRPRFLSTSSCPGVRVSRRDHSRTSAVAAL